MANDAYYKKGQLVQLNILNRCFTEEGFATAGTFNLSDKNYACVYSEIRLTSYPSSNDFFGEQTVVCHGDLATILSFKGRPSCIAAGTRWECYDIYEVLIGGSIRDVFCFNILPLNIISDLENEG
jgi:hypothetical protein